MLARPGLAGPSPGRGLCQLCLEPGRSAWLERPEREREARAPSWQRWPGPEGAGGGRAAGGGAQCGSRAAASILTSLHLTSGRCESATRTKRGSGWDGAACAACCPTLPRAAPRSRPRSGDAPPFATRYYLLADRPRQRPTAARPSATTHQTRRPSCHRVPRQVHGQVLPRRSCHGRPIHCPPHEARLESREALLFATSHFARHLAARPAARS